MSRHLSTRNISSKSMHAFLSNLANRQTDRQTDRQTSEHRKTYTSSVVGGKLAYSNRTDQVGLPITHTLLQISNFVAMALVSTHC